MAEKSAEERRRKLKEIFDRIDREGGLEYDGSACDLIRELRERDLKKQLSVQ